jgi:hypothetical protein
MGARPPSRRPLSNRLARRRSEQYPWRRAGPGNGVLPPASASHREGSGPRREKCRSPPGGLPPGHPERPELGAAANQQADFMPARKSAFGCQKGTQSRQHLSLYVAHKLRGVVDASVPVAERAWYLFPAPEPLYCAPSPGKGGWGQPQQRHECHSSGTFRRVKYSVVRSKKLCELEPPYGIEP